MKPLGWNTMDAGEKKALSLDLAKSVRGQYLISQALVKAIDVMKTVHEEAREVSNIQDMEVLLETFPIFAMTSADEDKQKGGNNGRGNGTS